MANNDNKIDSTMLLTVNAKVIDQIDPLNSVAISRWAISKNHVNYHKKDSHTLSVYVSGGDTSYRVDQVGNKGAPGHLCLMPQDHSSDWHINGDIEFVHLYFSDRILKQFAISHYDMDVRNLELQDLTYEADNALRDLMAHYVHFCETLRHISPLFAEETLYQLFDHLISHYNAFSVKKTHVKSGMSPYHIRHIKSAIFENMQEKITIADLAELVGLSPYHFARMFKLSFGETPAQFITRARLDKVRHMLGTKMTLAEISTQTGFSQQSHMTEQFRRHTGFTPAAYRREMASLPQVA